MAKHTVSNSGCAQGFKGTGNLLQDLLSSTVSINKLDLSSLLNHKPLCSTVFEDEDENKGLTLFSSSCSVCFSDGERVEVIKEAEVDILKEVVFKSCTNVTRRGLGFNWICTHCSATLGRLVKCRQEIENIVTCLQSVIRIQIATGQRPNLIHASNGAVRDVSPLSMATTARVPLAKNEASNPKCVPPSEYNAQESVGLDCNVVGNIPKDEGDTANREGINTSHVEDESEDKSIWVPIHAKEVPKLGEDPLDLPIWPVIQNLESTGASQLEQDPLDLAHRTHTREKPFLCRWPRCGKRYSRSYHLQNHRKTHTGERPFVCQWPRCGKRFTRSDHLQNHRAIHTRKNLQCPECPKKFKREACLSSHIKSHSNSTGDTSVDKSHPHSFVNAELRLHTEERPFVCDWPNCAKRFKLPHTLRNHYRIHTGEKNFQCPECPKKFGRKAQLDLHVKIHSKSRIAIVTTNGYQNQNHSLNNAELRLHTGERPFVCDWPNCAKRFKMPPHLRNHYRIHTGEKNFQCPECPKKFGRKAQLGLHVKIHSKSRIAIVTTNGYQNHSLNNEEVLKPVVVSMEFDIVDEERRGLRNSNAEIAHMKNVKLESTMPEDGS